MQNPAVKNVDMTAGFMYNKGIVKVSLFYG